MREKGIIYERCKQFSIKIIELCRALEVKGECIISKQIIRSATSIGANYSEALGAESDSDFVHKISVSLKEAHETQYWLDILKDSGYISEDQYDTLYNCSEEIYKMMTASVITVKKRMAGTR
ncbi:MAG: four helix bundle protein [Bacteroidales bacterium]|nr:four helix bundle protein [Bacteroidales bacterium]